VGDKDPTGAQLDLGNSAAHVEASFVAVFRKGEANDFHSRAAIEQNEKVREKGEAGARSRGRVENVPPAGMEVGGQQDRLSAGTAINGWLPIHEEDRGGNFSRGALPAAALSGNENDSGNQPKWRE
jgi:hypothetical protein